MEIHLSGYLNEPYYHVEYPHQITQTPPPLADAPSAVNTRWEGTLVLSNQKAPAQHVHVHESKSKRDDRTNTKITFYLRIYKKKQISVPA